MTLGNKNLLGQEGLSLGWHHGDGGATNVHTTGGKALEGRVSIQPWEAGEGGPPQPSPLLASLSTERTASSDWGGPRTRWPQS